MDEKAKGEGKVSSHKDIYGILELLAKQEQKNLNFEFMHQLKNIQKIISSSPVDPYTVQEEDAYKFIYENIWEKYFEVV